MAHAEYHECRLNPTSQHKLARDQPVGEQESRQTATAGRHGGADAEALADAGKDMQFGRHLRRLEARDRVWAGLRKWWGDHSRRRA